MAERVPTHASLRLRLIVGAAVIALVAVFTAALAVQGTVTIARQIERAASAQQRIDLLSGLSARISDYAVIAVETAAPEVPVEARRARLGSQAERVEDAFAAIDIALGAAVAEVAKDGEAEQMRRATRSLVLARMRAQFQALTRSVDATDGPVSLRAYLDGFATQFSPLLNEAVNEEQRDRDAAHQSVSELRERMVLLALAAAASAAVLTVLFYFVLVRPLMRRLASVREAAAGIGEGDFGIALEAGGQSEIDWLMQEINRTAARLRERQDSVTRDRAALNETIAERTARLEEANARLARIDGERRRFFADIGHELRTPLTVILAESELGLSDEVNAEDATEALSVIRARAKRLNRRIDDLLRVARSETGQIELDAAPFDLASAAEEALSDMAPLAKRRGVTLVPTLAPTPATGDADWTRQVISGLIENAIKKSQAGGVIEVSAGTVAKRAQLCVTDEGEGLPPADAERVFDRFARGTREASGSGFGVGLALARWVLQRQAGGIELESPAPRPPRGGGSGRPGAQVRLHLPAVGSPSPAEIREL
ncbi:MAG: HAMP domain-containing sensor histidine kinase [Pseudomonadota bacterium]